MRMTVDTRPLFLLGRKHAPRAYKGLSTRLGWHLLFHPLIQTSSHYFSRLKWVCRTKFFTSTERHNSSLHLYLWVHLSAGNAFPQPNKNYKFLRFFIIIIRKCGSTLYVGLAHVVSPTNVVGVADPLPNTVLGKGFGIMQ